MGKENRGKEDEKDEESRGREERGKREKQMKGKREIKGGKIKLRREEQDGERSGQKR